MCVMATRGRGTQLPQNHGGPQVAWVTTVEALGRTDGAITCEGVWPPHAWCGERMPRGHEVPDSGRVVRA